MATMKKGTFGGANVFLSRSLVAPEVFDAVHDALKLNGANVFLCCDPSRAGPSDYHVISSWDHERFADLRAKGCNLLGPQCILSCAKEHRILPNQGYTCCLAMDGVKVLASGFEKDEKVKIEQLVTAMGGSLHSKTSLDVNFVIVKNVLAAKYKWALNVLKKPIVNMNWLNQCWNEHRIVPQEPYRILPFTGLSICVTKIPPDQRKEMEKLIVQNGGTYSADLMRKCTHLISDAPGGDKYMVARRWGHIHIVTRRWVDQSIARRACLDEGLYPVHGNSVPCIDAKGLQKDKKYQENSSTTSQPVPSTSAEEVEATFSQNISSSFSDVTKIDNEGTNAPILQKNDEVKSDSHFAEDSETEDNDLYLSDCRIFLVGFEERQLSKLLIMIRKGGGTRHMLMGQKLTHIIVGAPSEVEKKEVRRFASWGVVNVVKANWLEECDRAKKELPVSPRHIASELVFLKDSTCFSMEHSPDVRSIKNMESSAGVTRVPMVHPSNDKKYEAEVLLDGKSGRDKSVNELSDSVFTVVTKSEQSNQCHAVNCMPKGRRTSRSNSATENSQSTRFSKTFKGKIFCFSASFPQDRRAQVIEWVSQGGGIMVDDQRKMIAHFIIECHGLSQIPSDTPKLTVVSTHWIRSCLEEGCILDIGSHIIYSPLCCHVPLPGFQGLRFCVSQYDEKDRLLLKNLCFTLGAKFTDKLTRKVTHLLCKFSIGPKYEAACEWGIQPVTAEWITECITQDMLVALDPFRPKPPTAEEREAGLCTMSQYPTQAACMTSGCVPSQLPSQSQGPGVLNDQLNEEPDHVGVLCKRSRLLEIDSNFDASKKEKVSVNTIGGSSAHPDVAKAIEDLLAQSSSKIQDMKSPETSGRDQNIFPPDHSVLGQDDESSRSTFEISRQWLSRTQKQDSIPNTTGHCGAPRVTYEAFSETQTESQVVGYEEDLSGRQRIIDRVRSQSMTSTPDK